MKHFSNSLAALSLLLGLVAARPGQAQTLDPAFQPTVLKVPFAGGLQTGPQLLLVQPDGKTLVGGGSDFANGTLASKLLRLNADGTPDATFNPGGTGANGFIGAMALQPDGKILIVGGFTAYNGTPQLAQARLNADGTLDASFAALPLANLRQLGAVAVQPDGKVLIGGSTGFSTTPLPAVVRLQANGTADASFNPPASTLGDFVRAILVQADGSILLGGSNTSAGSGLNVGLQRLTATGSADATFSSPLPGSSGISVSALAQQPDGKLLVGGGLAPANSANPGVLRLLPTGSVDATFATGSGPATATGVATPVRTLALLPNGNVLVGGNFAQYNGTVRGRVVRLLPTGAVDATFTTGAGANNSVTSVAPTASGQVVAAGIFTQYDGGGTRTGLTRLTAAGAEDATFSAPVLEARGSIATAALLTSGQLLAQGTFSSFNGTAVTGTAVRRLTATGTLDATYSTTAGTLLSAQPDGTFFSLGFNTAGTQYTLLRVLPTGALDNAFANPAYVSAGAPTTLIAPQGIVVQPDGKLLVFGVFTTFGGAARNGLVRLNADGTVDNSFVPPAGTLQRQVYAVSLQASGKLVISYNELVAGSLFQATGTGAVLLRLNTDGSLDSTFPGGAGANAGAGFGVLTQPDGKLLLSGVLTSFNGQATPYGAVRLTVDGAVDNTFNQLTAIYNPILVQPDGRILASTNTDRTTPTSYGANTLVRLNSNGSLDGTFAPISTPRNIFTGDNAFNGFLYQAADNKIITYGSFTSVLGQPRVGLARIIPGVVTATRAATAAQPLVVYPNPAHQQLTVVLPAGSPPTQATLRSLTGQVVRQWALPAHQPEATLDLGAVAAGLYVLQVPGPAGMQQQKVVVAP